MTTKSHNPADKVERWKIEKLVPYARNARTHSDEQVGQIAASIKEWGWTTPVLVDEQGSIIAGHGRTLAAQRLQMTEVPVMVAKGWSDAKKRAYVLADNKLAMNAGWDNEMLALELGEIGDLGFDLDLTGFTADEIAALTPEQIEPGLTDEDEVPDLPEQPVTVLGDVWVLGKHRLMCGDSTSIDAVDKLMDGQKADMVFTDPPYGVAYEGGHNTKKRTQIKNDALEGENLTGLFYGALSVAHIVTHEHAAFYVWYASGKSVETFAALSDLPLKLRAIIQWYKVRSGLGAFMSQYKPNCEPCIYAHKDGSSPQWFGPTDEKTVWELKKEQRNDFHPTQKPIELPERAINNSSKKGQIILDLFGGSGSTIIAAEKTSRQARLMELDPKYVDVIIKRWQDFTGKIATHAETGKPFAEVTNGNNETKT
jgi:DNA modification methylase